MIDFSSITLIFLVLVLGGSHREVINQSAPASWVSPQMEIYVSRQWTIWRVVIETYSKRESSLSVAKTANPLAAHIRGNRPARRCPTEAAGRKIYIKNICSRRATQDWLPKIKMPWILLRMELWYAQKKLEGGLTGNPVEGQAR